MITAEHLSRIAPWSRGLNDAETERARSGIIEKPFHAGEYIALRGDKLGYWAGVASGLVKLGTGSSGGKTMTFAGIRAGAWFGEGSVLKDEPRRYDIIALRATRLAMMDRATFLWLFENSVVFNRFLVGQLNERLGQFMALVEYDRMLDSTARLARCIASMFNVVLYPDVGRHIEITQEELGAISGLSRQVANQCLKTLEKQGLLRIEYGGITIIDLERMRRYGE